MTPNIRFRFSFLLFMRWSPIFWFNPRTNPLGLYEHNSTHDLTTWFRLNHSYMTSLWHDYSSKINVHDSSDDKNAQVMQLLDPWSTWWSRDGTPILKANCGSSSQGSLLPSIRQLDLWSNLTHLQPWRWLKHRQRSLDADWVSLMRHAVWLTRRRSISLLIFHYNSWLGCPRHWTSYRSLKSASKTFPQPASLIYMLQSVTVWSCHLASSFHILCHRTSCRRCWLPSMVVLPWFVISSWSTGLIWLHCVRPFLAASTFWTAIRCIRVDISLSSCSTCLKVSKAKDTTSASLFPFRRDHCVVLQRLMLSSTSFVIMVLWVRLTTRTFVGWRNRGMIRSLLCSNILPILSKKPFTISHRGRLWLEQWLGILLPLRMLITGSSPRSCSHSSTLPRSSLPSWSAQPELARHHLQTQWALLWAITGSTSTTSPGRFPNSNPAITWTSSGAEPGSIFVPAVLDDGNIAAETIMGMKAFLDVSGPFLSFYAPLLSVSAWSSAHTSHGHSDCTNSFAYTLYMIWTDILNSTEARIAVCSLDGELRSSHNSNSGLHVATHLTPLRSHCLSLTSHVICHLSS